MAKTKVFRKKSSKSWTKKRKMSINCKKPKGFSQKQYCKYGRKKNRKSHKKGGMSFYRFDLSDDEKIKRDKYLKDSNYDADPYKQHRDAYYDTPYGKCMNVHGHEGDSGVDYCKKLFPASSLTK